MIQSLGHVPSFIGTTNRLERSTDSRGVTNVIVYLARRRRETKEREGYAHCSPRLSPTNVRGIATRNLPYAPAIRALRNNCYNAADNNNNDDGSRF